MGKPVKNPSTPAAGNLSDGLFLRILWIISLFALLLRLGAAWEMARAGGGVNNVFTPPATSDLATYMRLAREIAAGNFPEEFYYQPFYYAVFLPLIVLVFGKFAVWGTIIIQSMLSAATVFLAGSCGKKVFDERSGLTAALFCAISSPLLLYVPFHQNETLQTFNLTLLFLQTLRAVERPGWGRWLGVGLMTGIAILTRGNVWLFLPILLAALIVSCRKNQRSWKTIAGYALCFFAALLLPQIPFIAHNTRARGTLTGPSTAANAVLALGNTPEAPAGGRDAGEMAGAMYYPESYRRMMNNASVPGGLSVSRQMWRWFCDEPVPFCELQFRKMLLFWDGREIPNNVALEFDGVRTSSILRLLLPGRSAFLLFPSLAGLLWMIPAAIRERKGKLLLLYGFVLTFYGAAVVFYMLSRFRAPILPLVFLFGGALPWQWQKELLQAGKAHSALGLKMAAVLLLSCWFVNGGYEFYRSCESTINRVLRPQGVILDLGAPEIHYFDHGPKPWGGWTGIKAEPGMILVKQFAGRGYERGNFYWTLERYEDVELHFLMNGVKGSVVIPAPKTNKSPTIGLCIPGFLIDGRITLQIVGVSAPLAIYYDRQRDYGRSYLNGEKLSGEWVMRFGVNRFL